MTGDDNITAIHIESALQQCVTFVGVNSTLQHTNPVVTTSLQSLCPSNCSNHGFCNLGNVNYDYKTYKLVQSADVNCSFGYIK